MTKLIEHLLAETETVPDWDMRLLYHGVSELNNRQNELTPEQRERVKRVTERFRKLAFALMGS